MKDEHSVAPEAQAHNETEQLDGAATERLTQHGRSIALGDAFADALQHQFQLRTKLASRFCFHGI